MSAGGMKFLHGSPGDYVAYFLGEDGRAVAENGYYGDGQRWVVDGSGMRRLADWLPEQYASWLAGVDPDTGEMRGRAKARALGEGDGRSGVLAYEYGVNVPKSASVVAALDPELGQVLVRAQERAAAAGVAMLRDRARVRVSVGGSTSMRRGQGPAKGSTNWVRVDELEVAVFSHPGSRDGDPQQHLHVQVGTKTFVSGRWRALAGLQMQRAIPEWNATVGAALATDEEWVSACAARGLTVVEGGGVAEVSREVERALSSRTVAIEENLAARVQAYRDLHGGEVPGAATTAQMMRESWEYTRVKKGDRPLLSRDEVAARVGGAGGDEMLRAVDRVRKAGKVASVEVSAGVVEAHRIALGRDLIRDEELGTIAAQGVAAAGGVTGDVRAVIEQTRLGLRAQLRAVEIPGQTVRWMPLRVEQAGLDIHSELTAMRAAAGVQARALGEVDRAGLTDGQVVAAEAVAAGLPVVIEGAAGTGKTTALRRAVDARTAAGLATYAVSKSAAAVKQLGEGWTDARTADGFLTRAGWVRDEGSGDWVRGVPGYTSTRPVPGGSVLVVDEAAMMDLPTLRAVVVEAARSGMRVALVGDDRQLAAVGAGGGFAIASRALDVVALAETKRFVDPGHEARAAAVRSASNVDVVADELLAAGLVRIHADEQAARVAVAEAAVRPGAIAMAGNNEVASQVSRLARSERAASGGVDTHTRRLGRLDEQIGAGDVVQTRQNNTELGVRNRDRFAVAEIHDDGALTVAAVNEDGAVVQGGRRLLPAAYVAEHVHHADVVTVHAAQGATGAHGHALVDPTWTREQLYVAITRGKHDNVVHVVGVDEEDARAVLRAVLAKSTYQDGQMVADVVGRRLAEIRGEYVPGLADDLALADQPLASSGPRLGGWGSSMFDEPAAEPVAPPTPGQGGPAL